MRNDIHVKHYGKQTQTGLDEGVWMEVEDWMGGAGVWFSCRQMSVCWGLFPLHRAAQTGSKWKTMSTPGQCHLSEHPEMVLWLPSSITGTEDDCTSVNLLVDSCWGHVPPNSIFDPLRFFLQRSWWKHKFCHFIWLLYKKHLLLSFLLLNTLPCQCVTPVPAE